MATKKIVADIINRERVTWFDSHALAAMADIKNNFVDFLFISTFLRLWLTRESTTTSKRLSYR